MGGTDPAAIRSLAVSRADVVNAFVYSRENPGTAVVRVTPPFHGRMRARLHVYHVDDTRATGAIHVSPADLLTEAVVEAYPTLESVEAERGDADGVDSSAGGTDDGSADPKRLREAYATALESWRERALESVVDEVTLEPDREDEAVRVTVKPLG